MKFSLKLANLFTSAFTVAVFPYFHPFCYALSPEDLLRGKGENPALCIDDQSGSRLKEEGVTWFDLQEYAVKNHIKLTINRADSCDQARLPNAQGIVSCAPFLGEVFKPLVDLRNNVSEVVGALSPKGVRKKLSSDQDLMDALFEHSRIYDKNLSRVGLRQLVDIGESVVKAVNNPSPYCKTTQDPAWCEVRKIALGSPTAIPNATLILRSVMWYLQAKSGQKMVLNPLSWQMERGFVAGGTYRLRDEGSKLFSFLERLSGVYTRKSSHFSEETKSDDLLFKHRGFDLNAKPGHDLSIPGKAGTKTILFGKLANDEMFFKAETFGTNTLSDTILHGREFIKHVLKERSGKRDEFYAHRESTHKVIENTFKEFLKQSQDREKKAKPNFHQVEPIYEKFQEKGKFGVASMSEIVETVRARNIDDTTNSHADALLHMLNHYSESICGTRLKAEVIQLKGCESIITIDP